MEIGNSLEFDQSGLEEIKGVIDAKVYTKEKGKPWKSYSKKGVLLVSNPEFDQYVVSVKDDDVKIGERSRKVMIDFNSSLEIIDAFSIGTDGEAKQRFSDKDVREGHVSVEERNEFIATILELVKFEIK